MKLPSICHRLQRTGSRNANRMNWLKSHESITFAFLAFFFLEQKGGFTKRGGGGNRFPSLVVYVFLWVKLIDEVIYKSRPAITTSHRVLDVTGNSVAKETLDSWIVVRWCGKVINGFYLAYNLNPLIFYIYILSLSCIHIYIYITYIYIFKYINIHIYICIFIYIYQLGTLRWNIWATNHWSLPLWAFG